MTAAEFKNSLKGRIPANYLYISRNMYSVKGLVIYLVYFNSRLPNVKISRSVVNKQHTLRVHSITGSQLTPAHFTVPVSLEDYSREIRQNSLIIYTDLAGDYMGSPNQL